MHESGIEPVRTNVELVYISFWKSIACAVLFVAGFHIAYMFSGLSFLIILSLCGILVLCRTRKPRHGFYLALGSAMLVYGPQLYFFYPIFNVSALALWAILSVWAGLFVLIGQQVYKRYGTITLCITAPLLWTGLEYFRCELYYLKFTWLTPGLAISPMKFPLFGLTGVYGLSMILMALASIIVALKGRKAIVAGVVILVATGVLLSFDTASDNNQRPSNGPIVAGVQLEFPGISEVLAAVQKLTEKYPDAELIVLSEYTLGGAVPKKLCQWCKDNRKYLVVGGKHKLSGKGEYYNTAFVVGPDGDIVFQQAKSIPIQFFQDGLPGREQKLWESPWGRIGICICYDLSYTRVVDELVRQGAEAIIVPTMDVIRWGGHEHRLHARIGPVRAAEYGIPVVRLCSSGISQIMDDKGNILASAPFPGQGETISHKLYLKTKGQLPIDRYVAPCLSLFVVIFVLFLLYLRIRDKYPRKPDKQTILSDLKVPATGELSDGDA